MSDTVVEAVVSHRIDAHEGDQTIWGDCCERAAMEALDAALAREAKRQHELAAALAPWREDG